MVESGGSENSANSLLKRQISHEHATLAFFPLFSSFCVNRQSPSGITGMYRRVPSAVLGAGVAMDSRPVHPLLELLSRTNYSRFTLTNWTSFAENFVWRLPVAGLQTPI
jgi:hypothetical protein